jgi:hypothetical protein
MALASVGFAVMASTSRFPEDQARIPTDEPEVVHHLETGEQCRGVAEVAARNDDPVRHFPVELLHDLYGHGLLSFDAQRVHRVGEIDEAFHGEALNDRHAAVEVRVETEDERAVGERLHQLTSRDLSARKEHDDGQTRRRAVGSERRARVPGRCARDRFHFEAALHRHPRDADEHCHAEVLEGAAVAVTAQLDPELVQTERPPVSFSPK